MPVRIGEKTPVSLIFLSSLPQPAAARSRQAPTQIPRCSLMEGKSSFLGDTAVVQKERYQPGRSPSTASRPGMRVFGLKTGGSGGQMPLFGLPEDPEEIGGAGGLT